MIVDLLPSTYQILLEGSFTQEILPNSNDLFPFKLEIPSTTTQVLKEFLKKHPQPALLDLSQLLLLQAGRFLLKAPKRKQVSYA
jgi:hypothetical protein